jgi:hypothetical protein
MIAFALNHNPVAFCETTLNSRVAKEADFLNHIADNIAPRIYVDLYGKKYLFNF